MQNPMLRGSLVAALLIATWLLVVFGPAMAHKAIYALRGQRSITVLPHLLHLDDPHYPNRETRRRISPFMGLRLWTLRGDETGAVSLAQAKLNAGDDIDYAVIDEFEKSSYLLERITFDDAAGAGGGGTFTYGYTRTITQRTAAFRAVNTEYVPAEVSKARVLVEIKFWGGSYQIDRKLAQIGAISEVELQEGQLIKATRSQFHDSFINGDSGVDANAFDGLKKALAGSTTEMSAGAVLDWTGSPSTSQAHDRIDTIDEWLGLLDEKPDAILGNSKSVAKLQSLARRAGYTSQAEDGFGRKIKAYDGIPLVDLGDKPGSSNDIVPIETRVVATVETTGLTDLYAVRFGLDGVHAASIAGVTPIEVWPPNFDEAGAVKTGEVEMNGTLVLRRTKAAGVLKNIKVQ